MGKLFNTSFTTEKEYNLAKAIIKQKTKCDLRLVFDEDDLKSRQFNHDYKKGLVPNAR